MKSACGMLTLYLAFQQDYHLGLVLDTSKFQFHYLSHIHMSLKVNGMFKSEQIKV